LFSGYSHIAATPAFVAVAAFPVQLPEEPLTLPVTLPTNVQVLAAPADKIHLLAFTSYRPWFSLAVPTPHQ